MSIHVTPQWQEVSGARGVVAIATVDHAPHGIEVRRRIAVDRPADSDPGETFLVRSQAGQVPIGIGKRLWLKSALTQVDVMVVDPQAPTPPPGDSDSSIATTGWVQTEIGAVISTLEDWGEGVGLGNVTADTAALQAAMATAGTRITGRSGVPFYYIGQGAVCAAGTRLENISLKAKLGPGGFNSKSADSSVRYDRNHVMLFWNGIDGGGCHNLEIYGDGGGVYALTGIALKNGFTTRPFVATGLLHLHHFPMIYAAVAINGVGAAGYEFDTLRIEDGGVSVPNSYWVPPPGFTQTTGIFIDGDTSTSSGKGRISRLIGKRLSLTGEALLTAGDQSDLFTICGSRVENNKDNGVEIGYFYAEEVNEPTDIQGRGNCIHHMETYNCSGQSLKIPHGGNHNWVGHLNARRTGRNVIGIGGSTAVGPIPHVEGNIVESVTGEEIGGYTYVFGTIGSATSTTAVLPPGSITFTDQWNAYRIRIRTGTGASTTRQAITACNATTQTITVVSWPAGTPNNTSTFSIHPANEVAVVDFSSVASATNEPKNNFVRINGCSSDGDMSYLCAAHGTGGVANHVEVNRDLGYSSEFPVSMQGSAAVGDMKIVPGPSQRSVCRLSLSAVFSTSATTEVTVPWDSVSVDTYLRATDTGVQASVSENGIRCALPGPKRFSITMRVSSGGADQMAVTGKLYRGSTAIFTQDLRMNTANVQALIWSFDVYHPETEFGGTKNLYTFTVQPSAATLTTFSNNSLLSWFSMSD